MLPFSPLKSKQRHRARCFDSPLSHLDVSRRHQQHDGSLCKRNDNGIGLGLQQLTEHKREANANRNQSPQLTVVPCRLKEATFVYGIEHTLRDQDMMWKSAPSLNFDPDGDDSFVYDEPDFDSSQPELHTTTLRSGPNFAERSEKSGVSVKVKASLLRNMAMKEKEIKDLFSQWKIEHKKSKPDHVGSDPDKKLDEIHRSGDLKVRPNSKSPSKESPSKKDKKKVNQFYASSPDLNFNMDDTFPYIVDKMYATAPNTPTAQITPRRKKKIAVKLKASDLNLSDAKKKEIEEMFWQWKGGIKDPSSPDLVVEKPSEDRRWVDDEKAVTTRRPKPASRQRSASLEPISERASRGGEADVKRSTSRTNSSEKLKADGEKERAANPQLTNINTLDTVELKPTSSPRRSPGILKKSPSTKNPAVNAEAPAPDRSSSAQRSKYRGSPNEKVSDRSESQSRNPQHSAIPSNKSPSKDATRERSKSSLDRRSSNHGEDAGEQSKLQTRGDQTKPKSKPRSTDAAGERYKSRQSCKTKHGESSSPKAPVRSISMQHETAAVCVKETSSLSREVTIPIGAN